MSDYVKNEGAKAYAENRHGPDGAILLDPFFMGHITDKVPGMKVIDIGTGAGPWAIRAAHLGARAVTGFDSSLPMLDQANQAIAQQSEEVARLLDVQFGTVRELPIEEGSFDVALSLNVGCALPSFQSDDRENGGTLSEHFAELNRVLIPGGFGIVTAPTSLGMIYTASGDEETIITELEERVRLAESDDDLRRTVGALDNVLRATVLRRRGEFQIAQPSDLSRGVKISRKIPGLVVPNFAHTTIEYEDAFADVGLKIVDAAKPKLTPEEAKDNNLGSSYTQQSPFATYLVQKRV